MRADLVSIAADRRPFFLAQSDRCAFRSIRFRCEAMSFSASSLFAGAPSTTVPVRAIKAADVHAALRAGMEDFIAMPTHAVFLVLIYPVIGILIGRFTMDGDLLPLAYPLTAGFALLGPFAAIGTYELSREREAGRVPTWHDAFEALRRPGAGSIAALALLQLGIFLAWITSAQALFTVLAGNTHPQSIGDLLGFALGTPAGLALIVLGNALGAAFAILAFTLSVVSLPLLIDRGGTAGTAVRTSIRAVRASPGPMALWGLIVAATLVIGCLPLLLGLTVVLPVLGHATWHLYRRVVPGQVSPYRRSDIQ